MLILTRFADTKQVSSAHPTSGRKEAVDVFPDRNDGATPKSEADQIVAALKKQNTPTCYLVGKDEGHGFAKNKNADYQFYATVQFTREYLLK